MIWSRSLEFLIDWEPPSGCLTYPSSPWWPQWQCWLWSSFTQQGDHSTVLVSQGPLLRWLKVNFSEAFVAWIHVKALRVFVESVLRWVNTEYRQRLMGKSKCTALFLVQFLCGRNPYTPCFVLLEVCALHTESHSRQYRCPQKKVTNESDKKRVLTGKGKTERHCLVDFQLQKENAFQ